jgi:hypothetical protein
MLLAAKSSKFSFSRIFAIKIFSRQVTEKFDSLADLLSELMSKCKITVMDGVKKWKRTSLIVSATFLIDIVDFYVEKNI